MQLAENIQREDLELSDQVKVIRELHDSLKSVQAVADTIKKSAPWVSKRLRASFDSRNGEHGGVMMTPATEAKAAAIRAGLKAMNFDPAGMLAMLTSVNKEEREQAKSGLRSITRHGQQVLAAEQTAQALAGFANRHEP